jgi:hypothetical protein
MPHARLLHEQDQPRDPKGKGTTMTEETLDITPEAAAALGEQLAHAFDARTVPPGIPIRDPDDTWPLQGGTAWVHRVPGNATLTKPVIIADGFGAGKSDLPEWSGLWGIEVAGGHAWGTQLHERGRDVIVLGYDSRNAPIADNAEVAIECIQRAAAERTGDAPLVVGGLSMGGLVTRYALAKLEQDDPEHDHEVGTYFSYDSPHRGAWIPISLQVFAHFMSAVADLLPDKPEYVETKQAMKAMQALINSTAARQLLWKHTETHLGLDSTFTADPARQAFLDALEAAGSFPQNLRRLAVANGRGDGQGLDNVTPGDKNLNWTKQSGKPGAALYTQDEGTDKTVAELIKIIGGTTTVKTSGIPALDGAPGGTLDSFAIAAKALKDNGYDAEVVSPDVCFVPVASAVDLADPSDPFAPVNDMDGGESGLHAFKVASQNEGHTLLTQELCDWLTDEFDRP